MMDDPTPPAPLPRREGGDVGAHSRAPSGQDASDQASVLVSVIMGSTSDWETMRHADETLTQFGVPHECRVVSAHRTPELMAEFAKGAEERGIAVIIAGAGGA